MKSNEVNVNPSWFFLFLAWIISTISTFGSLFFSEIMEFIPCTLCWYQRIFMYPLVIILFMGIYSYDKKTIKFALPLVFIGWFFALYHNLIHFGILPKEASPCFQGVPCYTKYIEWFGFITIPLLSFIAFSVILVLLYVAKKGEKN